MAALWLVNLLTLKLCITLVRATVEVQIEYVSYRNPQGKTREGKHCDALIFGGSTSACDPYFEMCLSSTLINSDTGSAGCDLAYFTTSRFWDKNDITASEFQAAVGIRTYQLSSMTVLSAAFVRVTVHDWDYLNDDIIDVYRWKTSQNLTNNYQWIYADLAVGDRKIQYRLRARCSPHYYQSSCDVFCQPPSNPATYICDTNGTRVYLPSAAPNTTWYRSNSDSSPTLSVLESGNENSTQWTLSTVNANDVRVNVTRSDSRDYLVNTTSASTATIGVTEVINFTQSPQVDVRNKSVPSAAEARRFANVSFSFLQFLLTKSELTNSSHDQAYRFEICISQNEHTSTCNLLHRRTAFLFVRNGVIDAQQFAHSLGSQIFMASLDDSLMLRFTAEGNSSVSSVSNLYKIELSNAATQYNLVLDGMSFKFELVALPVNNECSISISAAMKSFSADNVRFQAEVITAVLIPLMVLIAFGCLVYLVRNRLKKSDAKRDETPVSADLYEEMVKERKSTEWSKFTASLRNLQQSFLRVLQRSETRCDAALQGATQCDARSKEKSADYAKPPDYSSAFTNSTYVEISDSGTLSSRKVLFHASVASLSVNEQIAAATTENALRYQNTHESPAKFTSAANLLADSTSNDKEYTYSYPGDVHAAPSSSVDEKDLGKSQNWISVGNPYAYPSSVSVSEC